MLLRSASFLSFFLSFSLFILGRYQVSSPFIVKKKILVYVHVSFYAFLHFKMSNFKATLSNQTYIYIAPLIDFIFIFFFSYFFFSFSFSGGFADYRSSIYQFLETEPSWW